MTRPDPNSLQRKVDGENENQLSFIKSNVGTIIEQLDTLRTIRKKHQKEMSSKQMSSPTKSGSSSSSHLQSLIGKVEKSMENAKQEADQMFSQVLERKDTADATRSGH